MSGTRTVVRVAGALGALALGLARPLAAQAAPAGPTTGACTYDTCALRVEQAFFATRVVAGANGRVAARPRFGGYRLDSLMAGSPRALADLAVHQREARRGGVLTLVGTALQVAAIVDAVRRGDGGAIDSQDLSGAGAAALLGGTAVQFVGTWRLVISGRALNRALWWYNRDLPR